MELWTLWTDLHMPSSQADPVCKAFFQMTWDLLPRDFERKYCLLNNRIKLTKSYYWYAKCIFKTQLSSGERLGPPARRPGHMYRNWLLPSSQPIMGRTKATATCSGVVGLPPAWESVRGGLGDGVSRALAGSRTHALHKGTMNVKCTSKPGLATGG